MFYFSGKLLFIFNVKNGRLEGVIKIYYENGKIMIIINFKNGV